MLYTIARNGPITLLVGSMLFAGLLSVATAQTDETSPTVRPVHVRPEPAQRPTDTAPATTRTEDRAVIDARRETFKQRAAELRENAAKRAEALNTRLMERRVRISEKVENRVRTVVSNATSRLTNATARLSSAADRLEARARALAERGVAVERALALIDEARVKLRAVSITTTEDISGETDAAALAQEPKAAFAYVKESIREAQAHLKEARKLLHEAIAELKAAIAQRRGTETNTAE